MIIRHFASNTLSSVRFHGQNRPRDVTTLQRFDIVLTTYATLTADYQTQSILGQVEWYRIVLDEGMNNGDSNIISRSNRSLIELAHWIRNSTSKQFQATTSLHSRRRWCLTGTPVQNKLDDLASLAHFLKLPTISSSKAFDQYIMKPLSTGSQNFSKPLRTYMEAYCLRRSEKCLSLPPSREENIQLRFTSEERRLYDQILETTRRQVDSMVSRGDTVRCSQLFTALVKMRMFCNVGNTSLTTGMSNSLESPNVRQDCERCLDSDEDLTMLLYASSVCPDCGRPLRLSSPLPTLVEDYKPFAVVDEAATRLGSQIRRTDFGCSSKLSAVVNNVMDNLRPGNQR